LRKQKPETSLGREQLVQTMCQLGQLDANAQTVLAAAIADVHRQFVAKQQGDAGKATQLDD
jgi:hypothetical protein